MADVYLDLFLAKYKPEKSNADDTLGTLIATARIIKGQINALTIAIRPDPVPVKPEEKAEYTEFRNMVSAEKLDRFLKSGGPNKTGILLVPLIGLPAGVGRQAPGEPQFHPGHKDRLQRQCGPRIGVV